MYIGYRQESFNRKRYIHTYFLILWLAENLVHCKAASSYFVYGYVQKT